MKLIFAFFFLAPHAGAEDDFSATMRAFGRQTVAADLLVLRGEVTPTPAEVARAMEGLDDAIRGATALVGAGCEDGLLPAKVSRLETAEARQRYRSHFVSAMKAFRRLLVEYRDLIAAPHLDLQALSQKRAQIQALAQVAHLRL